MRSYYLGEVKGLLASIKADATERDAVQSLTVRLLEDLSAACHQV